jgi:hypothetical protein
MVKTPRWRTHWRDSTVYSSTIGHSRQLLSTHLWWLHGGVSCVTRNCVWILDLILELSKCISPQLETVCAHNNRHGDCVRVRVCVLVFFGSSPSSFSCPCSLSLPLFFLHVHEDSCRYWLMAGGPLVMFWHGNEFHPRPENRLSCELFLWIPRASYIHA